KKKMTEIALLFQLVTDTTSRVAIDPHASRDPSAPLVTQVVAQENPASQGNPDSGVVQLQQFVVMDAYDRGYATSGWMAAGAGSRRMAFLTSVRLKTLFDDFGPGTSETTEPFAIEPDYPTGLVRSGARVIRLNDLPIATLLDPATIE